MSSKEVVTLSSVSNSVPMADELSPWCFCLFKRSIDLVYSIVLIVATLPMMAMVAGLIKITSPGPILYQQRRLGRNGSPFQLLKFRSMHHGRDVLGPGITRGGDSRVTSLGRFLRRSKLDELPQLFNVVRGEMSLVGPRPDLPEYLKELPADQRVVLSLSPGITGAASLRFRNEEELLAQVAPEQLEGFYVHTLLPQKIELELEYARSASMFSDTAILLRTIAAVLH